MYFRFEFLPHTVNLNYQNTLLRTREEIALVVLGPFTIILLLIVMVLISAFIQFLFDRFPNVFSRFIMAFGLHCFLDPIWIVITDSALQRYESSYRLLTCSNLIKIAIGQPLESLNSLSANSHKMAKQNQTILWGWHLKG